MNLASWFVSWGRLLCRWSFGLPRKNGYYDVEFGKDKSHGCDDSDRRQNPILFHDAMMPWGGMRSEFVNFKL
jgi:hypothetical protein